MNYKELIHILESSPLEDRKKLLPDYQSIHYADGVDFMLLKYRRPDGDVRKLSVYKIFQEGEFDLIIFNVPWNDENNVLPFLPLIIQRSSGKIYGIMLPFNELHNIISQKQSSQIGKLAIIWTRFAMKKRFGIKI